LLQTGRVLVATRRIVCVSAAQAVLATSEVIPSRAVRALEGEGRELPHLGVVAKGAVVAPASQ